jgi:hypothetical protein
VNALADTELSNGPHARVTLFQVTFQSKPRRLLKQARDKIYPELVEKYFGNSDASTDLCQPVFRTVSQRCESFIEYDGSHFEQFL